MLFTIHALSASPLWGQSREKGPWWPHQIWGAEDQAGASNWITPAKVLQAMQLVKTGKIYELGQVYERDMPLFEGRSYKMIIPGWPTNIPMGKNGLVGNDDYLCAEIGQVGTQFDGPGHIGTHLKMSDGTEEFVFYNGFTKSEMGSDYGLEKLGIENVKPIITRGILIDIAGYKKKDILPSSYEVTVADVRGALSRQGIAETSIKSGDALLFGYGWSKLWRKPQQYNTNPPGIGLEVARWIAEKQASMVGSDSWTTEVVPNPDPELAFPVHQELLPKNGIFNLENMVFDSIIEDGVYEFLFIVTPIRFKGATGSPARPLALR
jgi:kynurenine formamidase